MNSTSYRQQIFPNVTPSLSAGEHEVRDYYGSSDAQRPSSNENYLTPYLGLQARLSQVWINRWTVLLLLILVRLLFAIGSVNDLIDDARAEALSACTEVENMGSTFASLPHYMSQSVNQLTGNGITKAVSGLHTMVDLTITGVEQMVIFYIGMLTNTYLCFITAAVSGTVSSAVDALEAAQTSLNTSLNAIANEVSAGANTIESGLNTLSSGINTALGKSLPTIDFSKEISELQNFKLPTDIDADLIKLNGSIPTFDQVKNFTDNLISTPFEALKTVIDNSWGNYTFNSSLFPVPEKNTLSFCSTNNNINNFFDDLKKIAAQAKKVFMAILLILAIAACIPMALIEIRRHRSMRIRATKIQNYAVDSMDAVYLASRPYSSDFGRTVANRFHSNRRQTLVRWCIAYCTSLPALFLISLALAGFFSCFCQWILLKVITKEVPAITAEIVAFADEVVGSINNSSQKWATDANMVILNETTKINTDLLGWVQTSTTAVNNTLNGFVDQTISLLNTIVYSNS
jgi:X-X-X-Leu-X-X-Gly heptad repeat protein